METPPTALHFRLSKNMRASVCKLFVALLVIVVMCSYGNAQSLSYTCYPNATIVITNPDNATYKSALAEDTDETCTTTWLNTNKAQLQLTDCDIDVAIVVSFSDREEDSDEIYGGATVATYTIKCAQIAATGIMRTVTQGLAPSLSTASEASVSPIITVSSALRSASQVSAEVISATVGDQLYWTLDVPEEYTAVPTICTVYPGTSTGSSTNKVIVSNGCSNDVDLVGNFDGVNQTDSSIPNVVRYWTLFWAFKFYNNDHILIHCEVKFCPPSSTSCDISCGGGGSGRKRRAIGPDGHDETRVKYGVTSRVLRVVERKPDFLIGSSNKVVPTWTCAIVAVITVVLLR